MVVKWWRVYGRPFVSVKYLMSRGLGGVMRRIALHLDASPCFVALGGGVSLMFGGLYMLVLELDDALGSWCFG
ncbi:MAG: hypothetical protein ACO2PN_29720 [Pyrobaculum sp.]